ncbi:N-acetylmannosamine-6-phosphate 2-epimerase [Butyricicoccus faecihominis]|uniref:N-acetylmannosamine-6-phosphate 2-epimerase n=1 Tax=Butyricicoccus faecihominis TaxID=1712515 RepID=UPI0024789A21|nr:N-acetylmannosamine-6-phosphate 2-epimerase [Butyricicoccus faecihominis]MCQ5131422.1 N-acetylmannosamine-6-phosphate 2-epimerase [Butyricicoccus faecihominis]
MLDRVKGGLIVSCQALPEEPLHSSFIMGRMARAAEEGGAVGIRANTAADIEEIARNTALPIIGIVKRDYADTPIYITPTLREIEELAATPCAMIALDATARPRHAGQRLEDFVSEARRAAPGKLLMADIATLEEAVQAEALGFDCVSTTLMGYTAQSEGHNIADNEFARLQAILQAVRVPVIAEGHVDTPAKAKRCLELGVHAVVVGGAITRPQLITRSFVEAMA